MPRHIDIELRDVGERVYCDCCDEEWTDRTESGGFLFVSKAYCPRCAKLAIDKIRSYNEEHFIRARCPQGMPFAKWVLSLRNGNNTIKTTTIRYE